MVTKSSFDPKFLWSCLDLKDLQPTPWLWCDHIYNCVARLLIYLLVKIRPSIYSFNNAANLVFNLFGCYENLSENNKNQEGFLQCKGAHANIRVPESSLKRQLISILFLFIKKTFHIILYWHNNQWVTTFYSLWSSYCYVPPFIKNNHFRSIVGWQ